MSLRRQVPDKNQAREPAAPTGTKWLIHFPNILKHCTDQAYENGDPRVPGWITVSAKSGRWSIVCKDPDAGASLRCEGFTVDEALELTEIMLGDPLTPWEVDKWLSEQRRKKKK